MPSVPISNAFMCNIVLGLESRFLTRGPTTPTCCAHHSNTSPYGRCYKLTDMHIASAGEQCCIGLLILIDSLNLEWTMHVIYTSMVS
jgi:hypothetical protein